MPVRAPSALLAATAMAAMAAATTGVAACSSGGPSGGGLRVTATSTQCQVSAQELTAGRHTFSVTNAGSEVTEVYVYGGGDRVVGEVENIGPGLRRDLTVDLAAGSYQVACKPGQSGDGIRAALTVTGGAASTSPPAAGPAANAAKAATAAVAGYRAYVEREAAALLTATRAFAAAVKAGDVATAKARYAPARLHWERIEPVAETFGDLDPRIDMRIDDVTEGVAFTGFHRLEQDLWQQRDVSGSAATADRLVADVTTLVRRIPEVDLTVLTMANGAKALLDEVARSKVTGEEERYSRADLVDFLGNVEGSRQAFAALEPLLATSDAALVGTLTTRFGALLDLLASHRDGDAETDFVAYDRLTTAQVRALAVAVDDLAEPLGQLTAAVARQ